MENTHVASLLLAHFGPSAPKPRWPPFQTPLFSFLTHCPGLLSPNPTFQHLRPQDPGLVLHSSQGMEGSGFPSSESLGRWEAQSGEGEHSWGVEGVIRPCSYGSCRHPRSYTYHILASGVFSLVLSHTRLFPASWSLHLLSSLPGMQNSDLHTVNSSLFCCRLKCRLLKKRKKEKTTLPWLSLSYIG